VASSKPTLTVPEVASCLCPLPILPTKAMISPGSPLQAGQSPLKADELSHALMEMVIGLNNQVTELGRDGSEGGTRRPQNPTPQPVTRCKCQTTETSLCCSRCFVPICPDCSRPSPSECCVSHALARKPFVRSAKVILKGADWRYLAPSGYRPCQTSKQFRIFFFWFCFLYWSCHWRTHLRVTGRKRGTSIEILVGSAVGIANSLARILNAVSGSGGDVGEALRCSKRKPLSYVAIGVAILRRLRIRQILIWLSLLLHLTHVALVVVYYRSRSETPKNEENCTLTIDSGMVGNFEFVV